MKLYLGTVQFGMKYGITNKDKISKNDISKIFLYLRKHSLKNIDTAETYGSAEKTIGNFNNKDFFNISSKIFIPNKITKDNWIEKTLNFSLIKTKASHFKTLFIHNPNILFRNKNQTKKIIEDLERLKKRKLIRKIGFSVYDPNDTKNLIKIFKPDIIQAPVNIFDHRFIQNDFLNYLKNKDIKLQARSIFLQGVILMNKKEFNFKFPNFISLFDKYHNFLNKNDLSPLENSIRFIKTKKIHSFVFGINSFKQFNDFLHVYNKRNIKPYKNFNFSLKDDNLINLNNWS